MDEKDPKKYELAVLVKTEEELTGIVALLAQHQAIVAGEPKVKKITLAYPIKKEREAIFGSYLFSATPDRAKALEKDLSMSKDVLRSMIIIAVPAEERHVAPSDAMMARRRPTTRPSSSRSAAPTTSSAPRSSVPIAPLSNEALEKRIEEISK